jgi:hypothetical protein
MHKDLELKPRARIAGHLPLHIFVEQLGGRTTVLANLDGLRTTFGFWPQ